MAIIYFFFFLEKKTDYTKSKNEGGGERGKMNKKTIRFQITALKESFVTFYSMTYVLCHTQTHSGTRG